MISPEIIAWYDRAVQKAKKKEIRIMKGAPHYIHEWLLENPLELKRIKSLLIDYIVNRGNQVGP